MAVVNPLLPIVISDKIGLDKVEVTAFYLLNTLCGIGITLGSGYLSDGLVARYKLVLTGGIVATLGNLGIAVATRPAHVFIAGPLAFAHFLLFPQLFAVAKAGFAADWSREDQVMGITTLRTMFSLGFIVGTGLASGLARIMDIQAAFFLVAGAILALTLYAARVLYRVESHIARQAGHPTPTGDDALSSRPAVTLPLYALILPLLSLAILQGADSTRRVYLPLVMFDLFHDASIAPLMFGITAAAELITMSVMGYLSSQIGERKTITSGAAVGAVYFGILAVTRSLPVLYFANVIYAVFIAALLGVAMAYIQGLIAHRAGMGGSLYVSVLNVGSLVGILSPLLASGYSQAVFIIPAVLCASGAILLLVGDRTAQIEQRLAETVSPAQAAASLPR